MNTKFRFTLALLGSAAIGAGAIEMLHAQAKPPALYISEIEITDPEAIRPYAAAVPSTVAAFGGKFLVRGGMVVPLSGEAPKPRMVVVAFDSMEKAQGWYKSEAYQKLLPIRLKNSNSRDYIVEGVAN